MSSDIPGQADPTVENGATPGPSPAYAVPPSYAQPRKSSFRGGFLLLLLVLIAFTGGVAATIWAMPRMGQWWKGGDTAALGMDNSAQAVLDGKAARQPGGILPADANPLSIAALEGRLAAVSAQLDGVSAQANAAGGNAARAEGLLIAFATRRALDRGQPLGYLEGELRLRFGNSQPRAVATIINAAHAPVTIADLQAGLEEVAPDLLGKSKGERDWWASFRQELSNLIIIRKADAPSPIPQKVIERAKLLLYSERVNSALQEVEALPDHEKADNWLQMARQYNEARRALDVIEAAAILEPRSIPVHARDNDSGLQVAPPPPNSTDPAPVQPAPASPATANSAGTR